MGPVRFIRRNSGAVIETLQSLFYSQQVKVLVLCSV